MAKAKTDDNGRKRSKDPRENQAEAMRQAVKAVGIDAEIADLQKELEKFGHKMDANMVSSYRSSLRRKMDEESGKPKRRRRKRRGKKAVATAVTSAPATSKGEDVLKDLRVMKDMATRLGPKRFRDLVGFVVD
jgi:hypothetical protein